jgi:hypothetical protein
VIADATDPIANTITNYVNAILQNRAQEINNKQTCQPIKYKPKPIVLHLNLKVFLPLCLRDDGHLDVSISNDDFYIHHP